MKGFLEFVREQGIIGLAVGFLLGGSVSKVVTSLVNDILNPILGLGLLKVGEVKDITVSIADSKIMVGNFLSVVIDFIIIAAVVYFVIKGLKLEKIDKKKEKK